MVPQPQMYDDKYKQSTITTDRKWGGKTQHERLTGNDGIAADSRKDSLHIHNSVCVALLNRKLYIYAHASLSFRLLLGLLLIHLITIHRFSSHFSFSHLNLRFPCRNTLSRLDTRYQRFVIVICNKYTLSEKKRNKQKTNFLSRSYENDSTRARARACVMIICYNIFW